MSLRVFLSHNSKDKPLVEALATRLKDEEIEPWFDKWCLIPGNPWQEGIEEALESCDCCVVLLGSSGTGPWHHEEMRAAIDRRVQSRNSFRVIPVLLPGGTRGDRATLPLFLIRTTWVEFTDTIDDPEALRILLAGIRGVAPGSGEASRAFSGRAPYRGLSAFEPGDEELYFGREPEVQWMLGELRARLTARSASRFLAIIGASGSGKSSLARAGICARLARSAFAGTASWTQIIIKPGPDPLESLAVGLTPLADSDKPDRGAGEIAKALLEGSEALHRFLRVRLPGDSARAVLLIDQLEETFTLCKDPAKRKAFLSNLAHAASVALGPAVVLVTLRSDFYGQFAAHPEFAASLATHQRLLGPLDEDGLLQAIKEPARVCGFEIEEGLAERLVEDVEGQPGGLPLLQHALLEIWKRRAGERMTWKAYRDLGGVDGALDRSAEEFFAALSDAEQRLCQRLFLRLVQPGQETEDTRRRLPRSELGSTDDAQALDELLLRLSDDKSPRLLSVSATPEGETVVEVAHEALLRAWRRLRGWIDERRPALLVQRRLGEDAKRWQASKHETSYLYRGSELAETQKALQASADVLNALEAEFLSASTEQERAERRGRLRARLMQVAFPLALLTFATTAFWIIKAREDRKDAETRAAAEEAARAVKQTVALKDEAERALNSVDSSPLLAMRLLAEASLASDGPEAARAIERLRDVARTGHLERLSGVGTPPELTDRYGILQIRDPGRLRLLRIEDGGVRHLTSLEAGAESAQFAADGRRFLVKRYGDAPLELRELGSNTVRMLSAPAGNYRRFSSSGRYVYAADVKRKVLWDVEKNRALWEGESALMTSNVERGWLLGSDGVISRWDESTGLVEITGSARRLWACSLGYDEEEGDGHGSDRVLVQYASGDAQVFDAKGAPVGPVVKGIPSDPPTLSCLRGVLVLTTSLDSDKLHAWSLSTGKELSGQVRSIGGGIYSETNGRRALYLQDFEEPISLQPGEQPVDASGGHYFVRSSDGVTRLRKANATGDLENGLENPNRIIWSPKSRSVLWQSGEKLFLRDLTSDRPKTSFDAGVVAATIRPGAVTFAPGGERVVIHSPSSSGLLLSTHGDRLALTHAEMQSKATYDAVFSRSGNEFAVFGTDDTATFWSVQGDALVFLGIRPLGRAIGRADVIPLGATFWALAEREHTWILDTRLMRAAQLTEPSEIRSRVCDVVLGSKLWTEEVEGQFAGRLTAASQGNGELVRRSCVQGEGG